jgi:hypothetical protein
MKAYVFLTSALSEWSASRPGRQGKSPRRSLNRKPDGPQCESGSSEEEKFWPVLEIEQLFLGFPARTLVTTPTTLSRWYKIFAVFCVADVQKLKQACAKV